MAYQRVSGVTDFRKLVDFGVENWLIGEETGFIYLLIFEKNQHYRFEWLFVLLSCWFGCMLNSTLYNLQLQ